MKAGTWIDPDTNLVLNGPEVLTQAAQAQVVLLGEQHDRADNHRWQMQVAAGLLAHRKDIVLGYEMFPARLNPVLTEWVAGALDLALNFFGVWISIQFIDWTKVFYDALEQMDLQTALRQIWMFFGLTGLSALTVLSAQYLRKHLWMVWRERLTQNLLRHWIDSKAYWYLRPGLSPDAVDNPDQRVAEDCRKFVDTLLIEGLELITECVALVSLVAILWGLSDFPLEFTLWGMEFSIDHYLVWLAFVYVALSSVLK